MSKMVICDTETSGLDPNSHSLLAIGLLPLDESKPGTTIYNKAGSFFEINFSDWVEKHSFPKYRKEWMRKRVEPQAVVPLINHYLDLVFPGEDKVTLVGHNIHFDMMFLRQLPEWLTCERISHRVVDTHTLLHQLVEMGRIPTTALTSDGAFEHFDISPPEGERHTALGDCKATRELYLRLQGEFGYA